MIGLRLRPRPLLAALAVASATLLAPPQAAAQTASPVANALTAGHVGNLYVGMSVRQVEALLDRRIPLDSEVRLPWLAITDRNELGALGVDQVAGIATYGADLQFDRLFQGDRRLRTVDLGIRCEDMEALRQRLDYEKALERPRDIGPTPPFAWGLTPAAGPTCRLSLELADDHVN